jgi:hypothetical protein
MTTTTRPYIDSETLRALGHAIDRSPWPGALIHRFERWQIVRGAETPQIVKQAYLVFAALLIGLALLLGTAAIWLVDSANVALGWTSSDERDPLYQRRRQLLNRCLRVEYPRGGYRVRR